MWMCVVCVCVEVRREGIGDYTEVCGSRGRSLIKH